jgi:glutathione S-transferase
MQLKLYVVHGSHPCAAVMKALSLKGLEYRVVEWPPTLQVPMQKMIFGARTVPGLRIGGEKVHGSRTIMRRLDELVPEPRLVPADPAVRARVEEAERWGDEELQPVPRRIIRWGLVRHLELRRWLAAQSGLPAPGVAARTSVPAARYYAHVVDADDAAVRRALADLPAALDRADALLCEGVLATDPPNAATLQVLCSVRSLDAFADLHDHVARHPCAATAREIFPDFPEPVPAFLPRDLLAPLSD